MSFIKRLLGKTEIIHLDSLDDLIVRARGKPSESTLYSISDITINGINLPGLVELQNCTLNMVVCGEYEKYVGMSGTIIVSHSNRTGGVYVVGFTPYQDCYN